MASARFPHISRWLRSASTPPARTGPRCRRIDSPQSRSPKEKQWRFTLDGELTDLSDPVRDGALEIVTLATDPRAASELIRHDTAHVMAEAVQELFPGTQVTIRTPGDRERLLL